MVSRKSGASKKSRGAARKAGASKKAGATKKSGASKKGGGLAAAPFTATDSSTVTTDARIVLVNVPGSERCSQEFKDKVMQIADRLGANPNFLMAVMSFETGATFSPSVRNAAGSGAVGLIQFMPSTARGLGTTTEALAAMTAEEQLDFVAKHFAPFKNRLKTIEDTYMAVLFPAAIGKGADHVLFRRGTKVYDQNRGLDINQDGVITVGEAAGKVRQRLSMATGPGTGEVLRRGVRSPEVEKLQEEMCDLGYMTRSQKAQGPGNFGPRTEDALKHFQRDNFLSDTGVYDEPTRDAIAQLNEGVKRGTEGDVVRGLQNRLVGLGFMTLAQTTGGGQGVFGPITENALKSFQQSHGIAPNGVLTDETYRALIASAPTPTAPTSHGDPTSVDTVLPPEGRGFTTYRREPGGADQVGRAATIRGVMEIAEAWSARHASPRLQIGDISRRGGGAFPPHRSHQRGVDVDVRPITNNGREEPTNIHLMSYSHELTKELCNLIREKAPGVRVFFNDERLISLGLAQRLAGHDDHLHVRFPG